MVAIRPPKARQTNSLNMPILRPPSSEHPNSNTTFLQSVASTPMAMSMMVDSMVNMMQINRPSLDELNAGNSTSSHDD